MRIGAALPRLALLVPLRTLTMALTLSLTLALAGCGGGLYFELGSGFGTRPPSVTLTTAAEQVAPGQTVRFVAAASDDTGIDNVALYRVDGTGAVLLGQQTGPSFEWQVTAPADGRTTLTVFARATDLDGNRTDSTAVSIPVIL